MTSRTSEKDQRVDVRFGRCISRPNSAGPGESVDAETQMIPKKEMIFSNIGVEDSPVTKMLIEKTREAEMTPRMVKEAAEIRIRSRNLLNELRMST
jgi:hypothetical protein